MYVPTKTGKSQFAKKNNKKKKKKNKKKKNLHTTTKSTIIGKSQFITKNELVFHYNFFLSI